MTKRNLVSLTLQRAFLILAVSSSVGCALQVAKSDPKPNVVLAKPSSQVLALRLAEPIGNDLKLSEQESGSLNVNVHDWRDTLTNGFTNAFRNYFKTAPTQGSPDLVLEVTRASLDVTPADVSFLSGNTYQAQLSYQARLLDSKGTAIKIAEHTVRSKIAVSADEPMSQIVTSAVEAMYEDLSKRLF
jgi:hypothetical protein